MKQYRWRHFIVNAYTKSEARSKLLLLWNRITFNPLAQIPIGDAIDDITNVHNPESEPIYLRGDTE